MKIKRILKVALQWVALSTALLGSASYAADPVKPVAPVAAASAKDLVLTGDAKCTACHDEADSPTVLAIGKTRHGVKADGRTPSCTSCHGESLSHLQYKGSGKPPKPTVTFDKKTASSAEDRNQACLTCHQKDAKRHLWAGSTHESNDVACTSCHQVHTAHDKVRDKRTQPEVCFACHKEQRAQFNKPSHHPTLEGKVACSDCHNSHGSAGPKLMKRDSVVETCYTCHMEKRGPFVHNHQPVSDDCSNCHMPHGTVADNLLKARPPLVCYQCHSGHGTPGVAGVAPGVTSSPKANTNIEQARGCLNCHTEIHGSNNPHGGQNLLPPAFFLR
jgi:DmsE family decaheme c-type cytochrome